MHSIIMTSFFKFMLGPVLNFMYAGLALVAIYGFSLTVYVAYKIHKEEKENLKNKNIVKGDLSC